MTWTLSENINIPVETCIEIYSINIHWIKEQKNEWMEENWKYQGTIHGRVGKNRSKRNDVRADSKLYFLSAKDVLFFFIYFLGVGPDLPSKKPYPVVGM